MNYIWEVMLDNKKNDIFLKQAINFSPYYEISPEYLYKDITDEPVMELNSMYRFDHIFSALFSEGITEEEWKNYFFDSCMHFLVMEDLKSGYTKKELWVRKLIREIEHGDYGTENQVLFANLNSIKKHTLATYLDNQSQMGESQALFAKVLIELLETGIVYKSTIKPKELLLYLGEDKKEELVQIIKLVESFFLPFDVTIRVFWKSHFAIMEEEQTMIYERIEIF